jgi:hypothetical protein
LAEKRLDQTKELCRAVGEHDFGHHLKRRDKELLPGLKSKERAKPGQAPADDKKKGGK